jgi:hypothetical protein
MGKETYFPTQGESGCCVVGILIFPSVFEVRSNEIHHDEVGDRIMGKIGRPPAISS